NLSGLQEYALVLRHSKIGIKATSCPFSHQRLHLCSFLRIRCIRSVVSVMPPENLNPNELEIYKEFKPYRAPKPPTKLPVPLFALIIGIDTYSAFPLHGSAADADSIYAYLTSQLLVPHENIVNLRNGAAKRSRIIEELEGLARRTIPPGSAIFIYYSGHGGRVAIPEDWVGYSTIDSMVEILCPVDLFVVDNAGVATPGISDRVLNCLLHEISQKHGNNVTLILDCCHSGGMGRSPSEESIRAVPRSLSNSPPFPRGCDAEILERGDPLPVGMGQAAYVLLAAAARGETAGEWQILRNGQPFLSAGFFTTVLLDILAQEDISHLSYKTLMSKVSFSRFERLLPGKKQIPHHEGFNIHRCLFRTDTAGRFVAGSTALRIEAGVNDGVQRGSIFELFSDAAATTLLATASIESLHPDHAFLYSPPDSPVPPRFYAQISGQHGLIVSGSGSFKIAAGGAHGIRSDSTFCLFSGDIASSTNVALAVTGVASLDVNHTLLSPPPNIIIPSRFYAVQVPAERVVVHLSHPSLTTALESISPSERLDLVIAMVKDGADIRVSIENVRIVFDWGQDNDFSRLLGFRIRGTIPLQQVDRLPVVLRSFAQFKYHLWRNQDFELGDDEVELELKRNGGRLQSRLEGPQLLGYNSAIPIGINGTSGPLSLMVHNHTPASVYLYILYFGSDLAISPIFLPAYGTQQTSDIVLRGNATFSIGRGDGGRPISFSLPTGRDVDIGFFKLFVTTVPVDFFSLLQDSPFSGGAPMLGRGVPVETTFAKSPGSESHERSDPSKTSKGLFGLPIPFKDLPPQPRIRPGAMLSAQRDLDDPDSSEHSALPEWYSKTVPVIQRRS
ncbi:caspase domain-containing protein, partial [Mycena latifolia]